MRLWLYILPLFAYLYGAVPFSFLLPRLLRGVDIREVGSGNVGATNAARVLGFKFFPLIFLLDVSKGFLPTLAAVSLAGHLFPETAFAPHPWVVGVALAAILGHVFPVYLRFKGGKAVATSTGVFLVLAPWSLLIAAGVWGAVFLFTHYVSLASIAAAAALPLAVWLLNMDRWPAPIYLVALTTFGGLFVIWLHRSNIRRLLRGDEDKIGAGESDEQE